MEMYMKALFHVELKKEKEYIYIRILILDIKDSGIKISQVGMDSFISPQETCNINQIILYNDIHNNNNYIDMKEK